MTMHNQDLEERLRNELGAVPAPDFEAWCRNNPEAVTSLQSVAARGSGVPFRTSETRIRMMSSLRWIAATVLLAVGIAWLMLGNRGLSPALFAREIQAVDNVQEMTWTDTYYIRMTSEDGHRTWIEQQRRLYAYRHPGQYRETRQNAEGEILSVHITDQNAGRTLELQMKEKKAVLKSVVHSRDDRGPFAWVGDELRQRKLGDYTRVKSLSLQGTTKVGDVDVNVVRAVLLDVELGKTRQHDLYFDKTSQRLFGIWAPNDATLSRDAAEKLTKEPGQKWSRIEPIASFTHEIELQPDLKSSDFHLDVPEGFTIQAIAKPTVTEEEMLLFLRAAAQFNGGQFPDSPENTYDRDKLNAEWEKAESARTAEANELIAQIDRIRFREIYESPIRKFISDHAVPESFHYVGSGIKLSESDRMVAWYKPKTSPNWRAIYGDLSVRDIVEKDLPLRLENHKNVHQ